MIHCTQETIYSHIRVFLWLLSAFKAGYLNSTGFLLTGEFVSHVTGYGSRVGITMGHSSYIFGLELLLVPAFFILGSFFTALVLEGSRERYPPYYRVQILITILIGAIVYTGEKQWAISREQFGNDSLFTSTEYMITAGLCFVCGMKNALVSWTTFGKIKVTHLTGLSTDIGINLLNTFGIKKEGLRFEEPKRVNYIRIGIMLCFSTGAFVAAILFPQLGVRSLSVVLILSFFMSIISIFNAIRIRRDENLDKSFTPSPK